MLMQYLQEAFLDCTMTFEQGGPILNDLIIDCIEGLNSQSGILLLLENGWTFDFEGRDSEEPFETWVHVSVWDADYLREYLEEWINLIWIGLVDANK